MRKGGLAHLLQSGEAIFPVEDVDEIPHDRLHCLIKGHATTLPFPEFFLDQRK
jgi:hypothetical protein